MALWPSREISETVCTLESANESISQEKKQISEIQEDNDYVMVPKSALIKV